MMTTFRFVARASVLASTLAILALVEGCGSAPGADGTAQTEEALPKCDPVLGCYNGGGTGGGGTSRILCDPGDSCCYSGGAPMTNSACGTKLYNAGCRAPDGSAIAPAIQKANTLGTYWFEVYCPGISNVASDPDCLREGIVWHFAGNACTISQPPAGFVDAEYDPNCGGTCRTIL